MTRSIPSVALLTMGLCWPSGFARGQDIDPAIYLLVDTSGSMLENPEGTQNAYGDGSIEHPHTPGVTSRLYMAKEAIATVLNAYGEVWWGLARFQQNSGHNYLCMCHDEIPNNVQGCGGYGGLWDPMDECRLCDVMQPYPDYDLEGVHDRVCINYAGGLFDNCTDPITGQRLAGADILVPLGPNTEPDILKWIDHSESDPGETGYDPSLPPEQQPDPELRAVGGTPIGGSLETIFNQLANSDLGNDPLRGCRPYAVIVLTDGAESCDTDPVAAASALRQTPDLQHDCSGGCPNGSTCVSNHCVYDVKTYVVAFAVAPNELANNHAIAQAGGTGSAIQASNQSELVAALAQIVASSIKTELCNGADDDCDGQTDEDFPELGQACTNGQLGQCRCTGTYVCSADGSGTECNYAPASDSNPCGDPNYGYGPEDNFGCDGLDNDCDGFTDEGLNCGPPPPELCNGIDDDGDPNTPDGQDDPAVGQPCGSQVGLCELGTTVCVGGSVVCQGGVGPAPEACDGQDNDCDGVVDGLSESCYSPGDGNGCTYDANTDQWTCEGVCRPGIHICPARTSPDPNNTWGPCLGEVGPTDEICDNQDNDCDGQTDENLSEACYPPGPGSETGCDYDPNSDTWTCLGECQVGTRQCSGGAWGPCQGFVSPSQEVCDGLDNDCDGQTDEPEDIPGLGQPCGTALGRCEPGTLRCVNGVEVCEGGTGPFEGECNGLDDDCDGLIDEDDEVADEEGLPCGTTDGICEPGMTKCVGGQIVCDGGVQPTGEVCNGLDDDCNGLIDDDAYCPPDSWCYMGACRVACGSGEFPCPNPLVCKEVDLGDETRRLCVPAGEECGDELCPEGWVCRDGECVDPCDPNPCEDWQECQAGVCYDASCSSGLVECAADEFCWNHECIPDPCASADCDPVQEFCERECDEEGGCTATCRPVCACDAGQICDENGNCVPDPCAGVECDFGQVCADGLCIDDPCARVTCPADQVCFQGSCVPDPCTQAKCPAHTVCKPKEASDGTLQGWCYPREGTWVPGEEGKEVTVASTGGCNTAGRPSSVLSLFLILLIGLARRFRHRLAGRLLVAGLAIGLSSWTACSRGTYTFETQGHWDLPDAFLAGDSGARPDAGLQPDACVSQDETCDGVDNDCDGLTDEDFDLDSDPNNCGSCGHACEFPNAFGVCEGGECHMGDCLPGFWDVDGDESNGCEYNCLITNNGQELCDGADNDCDGLTDEDFDLDSDPNNCGQCHRICVFFQGTGRCEGGQCMLDSCVPPYVDRDGNPDNGCECLVTDTTDDCDGVDNDCDGQTDEDFQPSPCYTGPVGCTDDGQGGFSCTGECRPGSWSCQAGLRVCTNQVQPGSETCNGLDDDCNGVTDDGFDTTSDILNCGSCGYSCFDHAPAGAYASSCTNGSCTYECLPGFHDLNGDRNDPNGDGCEYACQRTSPPGTEYCDGADNDCDGLTDEASDLGGPPAGLCKEVAGTPCTNVAAVCQDGVLGKTWYCQYPASVETDPNNPNSVLTNETLCDGFDGNCDGNVDEAFSPAVGTACDDGNLGICRGTGTYQCNAQHTGTECVITNPGQTPEPEVCDGVDNDCDGLTDESFANRGTNPSYVVDDLVTVTLSGGETALVYRYEASRPTATATDPGSGTDVRACSRAGVLPWSKVTFEQARQACQRAGMQLCSAPVWTEACDGASGSWTYPYDPTTYDPNACNGADAGNGAARPTGSMPDCASDGYLAEDLSGNLREWTTQVVGYTSDGKAIYAVRGGSYEDMAGGLTCQFASSALVEDAAAPNVGFRCCTLCGNGVLDPGEECDDGNLDPGDGCSPVCGPETCGNGVVDAREECDCGTNPNQLPAGCIAVNGAPNANCTINCQRPEERCSSLYPEDQDAQGEVNDCADPDCAGTWCSDVTDDDGDGFSEQDGDCDDTDPNVNPAADEVCGNNFDDNCNGFVDDNEPDKDGDGALRCVNGSVYDCDDWNSLAYPTHPEICVDGIDNNCDGLTDQACATPCEIAEFEKSYIGCDYWAVSTMNHWLSSTFDNNFALVVNNANDVPANVVISKGGTQIATSSIPAHDLQVFYLAFDPTLKSSIGQIVTVSGGAYHLTSDMPVTVYQYNPFDFRIGSINSYTNDASLVLPSHVWTGKYLVTAWPTWIWRNGYSLPGYFAVVARQPGTQVQVTFSAYTASGNYGPGSVATFTLDAGDVLQVPSRGGCAPDYSYCGRNFDLTGTIVEVINPSEAAIGLFAGSDCTFIPENIWACDHMEEMIFPLEAWGRNYVAAHTYDLTTNRYRVVAGANNVRVTFYPSSVHAPVTLNQGDIVEFQSSQDFSIEADGPIAVLQFLLSQNNFGTSYGDPAMGLLVPVEQFRTNYSFAVPSSMTYNYVNIIKPVGIGAPTVYLDGSPIPESSFTPAIGNSYFGVARINISSAPYSHTITSDQPFGIMVYGYASYTSYLYPGGLDLRPINAVN